MTRAEVQKIEESCDEAEDLIEILRHKILDIRLALIKCEEIKVSDDTGND